MIGYLNKFTIHLEFNDEGISETIAYENSNPDNGGAVALSEP